MFAKLAAVVVLGLVGYSFAVPVAIMDESTTQEEREGYITDSVRKIGGFKEDVLGGLKKLGMGVTGFVENQLGTGPYATKFVEGVGNTLQAAEAGITNTLATATDTVENPFYSFLGWGAKRK